MVVDDGQIMVLGGLLKDEYGGSLSQVPFLGDLPVVGPLFRSDSRTRTKSNLMVFLRPMIIRSQEDLNALSMDRYDLIRAAQQGVGQPRQSVIMPINDAPVAPPPPPCRRRARRSATARCRRRCRGRSRLPAAGRVGADDGTAAPPCAGGAGRARRVRTGRTTQ